jgi:hypothetical protein
VPVVTDQRGLKAIGWAFGAATAAVFLIATVLVAQTATAGATASGYGTVVVSSNLD